MLRMETAVLRDCPNTTPATGTTINCQNCGRSDRPRDVANAYPATCTRRHTWSTDQSLQRPPGTRRRSCAKHLRKQWAPKGTATRITDEPQMIRSAIPAPRRLRLAPAAPATAPTSARRHMPRLLRALGHQKLALGHRVTVRITVMALGHRVTVKITVTALGHRVTVKVTVMALGHRVRVMFS